MRSRSALVSNRVLTSPSGISRVAFVGCLALLGCGASCVTPVHVESGTVRVGLFIIDRQTKDRITYRDIVGAGVSVGSGGFHIGLVRLQSVYAPMDLEGYFARTPLVDFVTGEEAERFAKRPDAFSLLERFPE